MTKINLKSCKKGDILISIHGKAFFYDHYDKTLTYPHIIAEIITGYKCSRLGNGQVFSKNKAPEDHDIVKVIPQN